MSEIKIKLPDRFTVSEQHLTLEEYSRQVLRPSVNQMVEKWVKEQPKLLRMFPPAKSRSWPVRVWREAVWRLRDTWLCLRGTHQAVDKSEFGW